MNRPGRNKLNTKHINVVNLYSPSYIHTDELEYFDATEKDIEKCNVEIGDIFLTRSSLKVEGIAQANILLGHGVFVFDDHIMRIKLSEEFEPFFVKESLNHSPTKKEFMTKSKTGTMTTIGQDDISSSNFSFPTLPEQTAIGSFFSTLDNCIAINQRKYDSLKKLKAAYLQQMFPQAGERVPRLRFDGFSGEWEDKYLGELVTQVVREVPKPDKAYKRLSIRSHAKGTFHQVVEEPEKVAMDKLYVVHENDLIVNITFAWEHAIAVAGREDNGLLVSHRFPTFEINKADINFIRILVSQEEFRKKMELISPGGAGRNRVLSKGDFVKISLVAPSINEQTAVGSFFRSLDDQIIVYQDKLNGLKKLKTAYLQKMFI